MLYHMTGTTRKLWCTTAALIASMHIVSAPAGAANDGEAYFEKHVRPLLHDACVECHNAKKHKAGLRLDIGALAMKGGESGAAIVRGNPEASRLVVAVRYTDNELQMPPKKKLSDEQIAVLERWVKMGAPWPGSDQPVAESENATGAGPQIRSGPPDKKEITRFRAEHWAMKPIGKPTPLSAASRIADRRSTPSISSIAM